jgi:single-stranded-DNA-specific exonuclease
MISRSVSDRNWILSKFDENKVKKINQELGISELLARLLSIRNIQPDECENFLNPKIKNSMPNPFSLKGMDLAVEHVIKHVNSKSKICIFGDYDVDGASSSAILGKFLRYLKCDFFIFIPDRIKDGYGPSPKSFEEIINKGAKLIITVDCGTTSFEAIEYANSKKSGCCCDRSSSINRNFTHCMCHSKSQ